MTKCIGVQWSSTLQLLKSCLFMSWHGRLLASLGGYICCLCSLFGWVQWWAQMTAIKCVHWSQKCVAAEYETCKYNLWMNRHAQGHCNCCQNLAEAICKSCKDACRMAAWMTHPRRSCKWSCQCCQNLSWKELHNPAEETYCHHRKELPRLSNIANTKCIRIMKSKMPCCQTQSWSSCLARLEHILLSATFDLRQISLNADAVHTNMLIKAMSDVASRRCHLFQYWNRLRC